MEITFKNGTSIYVAGAVTMENRGPMVVLKNMDGHMLWAGNSLHIVSMIPKPSPRA